MARSPLFGRRIHISGSVVNDLTIAPTAEVEAARELIALLVKELVKRGANFVIPFDAEPKRNVDGLPVCFDWLVWKTVRDNLIHRPQNMPGPFIVAVQHHKTEEQIPDEYLDLWDELRASQLIKIESAAYWNMNSKRMEAQARFGDVLIALGGDEGVLYLANLYHDAGKPIVPLNLPIGAETKGARRLYAFGLASAQTRRLFQIADDGDAHDWINRIGFPKRQSIPDRVSTVIDLLESLDRPKAFVVRLLNPDHEDYANVQDFVDLVAKPVLEDEFGYRLIVIDGRQTYDHARIDQEIFAKLHRSSVVLADITGARPNCFLELGYALGRGLPTMSHAERAILDRCRRRDERTASHAEGMTVAPKAWRTGDMGPIWARFLAGATLNSDERALLDRHERGAARKRGPKGPATDFETLVCLRWLVERQGRPVTVAQSLLAEITGASASAIKRRAERATGIGRHLANLSYDVHVERDETPALLLHRDGEGKCSGCKRTRCRCDPAPRPAFDDSVPRFLAAFWVGG